MRAVPRLAFAILILPMFLLGATAFAQEEEDFEAAKALIESGRSCNELTNNELELIGDYYMEQMHPGEAHEIMDRQLGGEGSENLRNVHINIAKRFYCGYFGMGMMGGINMMNWNYGGYGMMGGGWMWIYSILILAILVLLIIFLFQRVQPQGKRRT